MPHFSESELEAVKRAHRLEDLARAAGCELKKHGVNKLVTRCLWHQEKTPSLVLDVVRNTFKCFGCGKSGDVIAWVMETEGRDFVAAVERLAQGSGFRVQGSGEQGQNASNPSRKSQAGKKPVFDSGGTGGELLEQTVAYYHQVGRESEELREYLVRRGLLPRDADEEFLHSQFSILNAFRLGYANRTLGLRLEELPRAENLEVRRKLQEVGVMRGSGHEHLAGSLVVPICDADGRVVQLYGRKILDNLRTGTPKHLYLAGQLKGIFNAQGFRVPGSGFRDQAGMMSYHPQASADERVQGNQTTSSFTAGTRNPEPGTLILCEAIIDALTFWVHGFRNVTSCFGVNNFTEEMLQFILKCGFTAVYLAFDRDEAGDRGAQAVADQLIRHGIVCYRVQFPSGMDANEFALKAADPRTALEEAIRFAVWMGGVETAGSGFRVPGSGIEAESLLTVPDEKFSKPIADQEAEAICEVAEQVSSGQEPGVPLPAGVPEPERRGDDLLFSFGDRRYRVRGLGRNLSLDQMKVNLLASRGELLHVDTLEFYAAQHRGRFIKQAAEELQVKEETIKRDLGRLLLALELLQDQQIAKTLTPPTKPVVLTEAERKAALDFLKAPNLLQRLLEDFKTCGVVGEETNLLVSYLGAVSRLLDKPLGILIRSSSAAGKTSLMEAVLAMIPKEEKVKYSAMTGQSLFYMGTTDLAHKILAIAEEEGARQASYSLKLLQSEGEVSIASTGKDPTTGRLVTHEYEVKGPVMLLTTSTAVEIDEELLNRCIVLSVNEERDQTRAIHRRQRERETDIWAGDDGTDRRRLHQNAQRLLRPLAVKNPYAPRLTFLDDKTRTRRDHLKYLTLIRAIALLHQYQRPVRTDHRPGQSKDYIEVTLDDIALANRLANEVLGRSLDDLPPQTRQLLIQLDGWVKNRCEERDLNRDEFRFSRRDIREALGWHDTQLRLHLERLVALEYLIVHRGGRGQQFVYELLYDGKGRDGAPFVMGLIGVEALVGHVTTATSRGEVAGNAGQKRAEDGTSAPGAPSRSQPVQAEANSRFEPELRQKGPIGKVESVASYAVIGHIHNGHASTVKPGGEV